MEENFESEVEDSLNREGDTILRKIFLNLFISVFMIINYYYISEFFGSISSFFLSNSEIIFTFAFSMFILAFLSVLAGPIHGFISGFLGELLYQLSFYNDLRWDWCVLVALFGLACGIYKYKPLKYHDGKNVYYTFLLLILISMLFLAIILVIENANSGVSFLVISLISVIFPVPLLLILYDKGLASRERYIYHELLTHHPYTQDDHTFSLTFGRTTIFFCTRCSGMIIGGLVAVFWTHLVENILKIEAAPEFAVLMCLILPIPGLIDWGTQRLQYRTSTTSSRLLTGFIIGHALHFLSFTRKYLAFMTFILVLFFGVFFIMMFFGYRKELRKIKEDIDEYGYLKNQGVMIENNNSNSDNAKKNIIFIHGLESSGHGPKANLLRSRIPEILTPDLEPHTPGRPYQELLKIRMNQLNSILEQGDKWIIIGSSFGGLMGTLYACQHPEQISRMVLLAPYLQVAEVDPQNFAQVPLNIPVTIYHSKLDKIVDQKKSKERAEQLFSNIDYNLIEDDEHRLQNTAERIDWKRLLNL